MSFKGVSLTDVGWTVSTSAKQHGSLFCCFRFVGIFQIIHFWQLGLLWGQCCDWLTWKMKEKYLRFLVLNFTQSRSFWWTVTLKNRQVAWFSVIILAFHVICCAREKSRVVLLWTDLTQTGCNEFLYKLDIMSAYRSKLYSMFFRVNSELSWFQKWCLWRNTPVYENSWRQSLKKLSFRVCVWTEM